MLSKPKRVDSFLNEHLDIKSAFDIIKLQKLDENSKVNMSVDVAKKIYTIAVKKLPSIDFGDIPMTKGDITKFTHYSTMQDALAVITEAVGETEDIVTVRTALNNLEMHRKEFTKAYIDNIQALQYLYCLTVLACLQSITLLIASYMTFMKNPSGEYTYASAVTDVKKVKSMEALSLQSLDKFNRLCLEKGITKMAYETKEFLGTSATAIAGFAVAVTVFTLAIPVIREMIYQFYYMRTSVSDYIDAQIALIELSHATNSVDKNAKKKQEAIIKKLSAISDKIRVDAKVSEDKARKEMKSEKIPQSSVSTEADPFNGI